MKNLLFILSFTILSAMDCTAHQAVNQVAQNIVLQEQTQEDSMNVNVKIGNTDFSAVFYHNDTTQELVKQFPITCTMSELHGNEKYYTMSKTLPTNAERPDTIQKGDIMLYGSDCIVLFYDTFPNSFSYTKLGYIEDTTGLENAVGKGQVSICFSFQEEQ